MWWRSSRLQRLSHRAVVVAPTDCSWDVIHGQQLYFNHFSVLGRNGNITEMVDSKQDTYMMEKCFRKVYGEDGTFVSNVLDINGRLHIVFGGNMAERLESYRQNFPVFDDDLYLLTYPKSGEWWYLHVVANIVGHSACDYFFVFILFDDLGEVPNDSTTGVYLNSLDYIHIYVIICIYYIIIIYI